MANVNLLNHLAGSVVPPGKPFNATQSIMAGQELAAGKDRLAILRAKLDEQRTDQAKRAEIARIMAAGGTPGEIGRNIMALDPDLGLGYLTAQRKQDEMADADAERRARELAIQNWATANGIEPAEAGILMADPANASKTIQGNILGPAATGPEYGLNPIRTVGPDGETSLFQLGKGGETKPVELPDGYRVASGTSRVDLGTGWGILDNASGNLIGVLPKDLAGEEAAKAAGRTIGEREKNKPKARQAFRDLTRQWDIVLQDIEKAKSETGFWTSGWAGRLSDAIPGTPAYNLARTLETIKANIGFDKLQSMRDNSPTGGALGQVSEFENRLLQAVQGSLEQGQSAEQLLANLDRIRDNLMGLRDDRARAYAETYGEPLSDSIHSGAAVGGQEASISNGGDYTAEDIEYTARKYGMTVEQVKQRLGVQ